jgi:hypothetical protein
MGRLSLIIATLALLTDIAILVVLLMEFNYDKVQDEKREYKEAQKRRKKAKVEQQTLREGTGGVLPEAGREMCDLPKASKPVQTPSEFGSQP